MYIGEDVVVWNLLSFDEQRDMYKVVKDSGVVLEKYILDRYKLNDKVEEEQQ